MARIEAAPYCYIYYPNLQLSVVRDCIYIKHIIYRNSRYIIWLINCVVLTYFLKKKIVRLTTWPKFIYFLFFRFSLLLSPLFYMNTFLSKKLIDTFLTHSAIPEFLASFLTLIEDSFYHIIRYVYLSTHFGSFIEYVLVILREYYRSCCYFEMWNFIWLSFCSKFL